MLISTVMLDKNGDLVIFVSVDECYSFDMMVEQHMFVGKREDKHDADIGESHESAKQGCKEEVFEEGEPMRRGEPKRIAVGVVSYLDDPSHLYRCALNPDGKKARVCIATPECAVAPEYLLRHEALERHLWKAHCIVCNVPGGFNMEDDGQTHTSRKNNQIHKKALETYKGLSAEMKSLQDEKDFIEEKLQMCLVDYDSKEQKMKHIQNRISRGYELVTRDGRVHVVPDKQQSSRQKLTNEMVEKLRKGLEKEEKLHKVDMLEKRWEHMHPLENGISITSGSDEGGPKQIGLVEIVHGFVNRNPNMDPGATLKRFEVTCRRVNLSFSMSRQDVDTVAKCGIKASTAHMNLFNCWKEFTLSIDTCRDMWILDPFWLQQAQVGKMRHVVCHVPASVKIVFIPVCYGGHWTLYVAVNFTGHDIVALNGREGILFMESMNSCPSDTITSLGREVVETIYNDIGVDLKMPVVSLVIPAQPNGDDCGWYVMHCIDCFIEDILQGVLSTRFATGEDNPFWLVKVFTKWVSQIDMLCCRRIGAWTWHFFWLQTFGNLLASAIECRHGSKSRKTWVLEMYTCT